MAVNPADRPGGQQLIDDYVNVLVFSQKGERPLPHKLAGADLVGAADTAAFVDLSLDTTTG